LNDPVVPVDPSFRNLLHSLLNQNTVSRFFIYQPQKQFRMSKIQVLFLSVLFSVNLNQLHAQQVVLKNSNLTNQVLNKRMTTFDPAVHGFKFSNTFKSSVDLAGINGLRLGGLCGGMVYSALDYYNRRMPIPKQTYRPANRAPLQSYIYKRQSMSLINNPDKWTELIVNPFGLRNDEFFNWGLQGTKGGRIQELQALINSGNPAPLGLFAPGGAGIIPHHQVLAIGYQMGRYKGDLGDYKEEFKIFIYDPNYPGRTMTLRADLNQKNYYYEEAPEKRWTTYFVDKKYASATPPVINCTPLSDDNIVRELVIEIETGSDDLRGVMDNFNITVLYRDGSSDVYTNVNRSARWIDNYCETVSLVLRKPAAKTAIRGISIQTTFGGGLGGDNWNMDALYVLARSGNSEDRVISREGRPLVRFDGNNTPFIAEFQ
jgi:hypothetical protein